MTEVEPLQAFELELRRITPRLFLDRRGRYLLEDVPNEPWHDCRVIDVSVAGAGLVVADAPPPLVRDQHITLAVQCRGVVRNLSEGKSGVRIGMEFLDLSRAEEEYVRSLQRLGGCW